MILYLILKLNNNHLTQLLTGQFYNLINLKQLDLSRNEIKFIDAFNLPFLNLFHLVELDLSENNLQNVYSLTFSSNLLRLQKLVLNNANINDIENDAFSNSFDLLCTNNRVTMIYLHQNPINFNYLADGLCFKITMNEDFNNNDSTNSILYPFGKKENDKTMFPSDDYYEGPIQIKTEFKFYNKLYSFLYINTNGFISFENPLDSLMKPLISPFNADINTLISGNIYYREVITNDYYILNKITNDINAIDVDFNATWAFVVTWFEVSAFDGDPFENNTFQVVLTSCKENNKSFVLFNYGHIMWFHDNVKAGFDSGDRINLFYLINGSSSLDVINLSTTSNVNQAGKNVFRVDNGFSYPSYSSFSESNEKPSNCNDKEQNGINSIYLNNSELKVFCQSNGWIRIMNRVNSIINDFNRTIQEYKNGFSHLESNYWLGLSNIKYLTSQSLNERILLRIEFKSVYSDEYFIEYDNFKLIGNDYELNIGKVTNSNLIDLFSHQNGSKFTTFDQDNDMHININILSLFET